MEEEKKDNLNQEKNSSEELGFGKVSGSAENFFSGGVTPQENHSVSNDQNQGQPIFDLNVKTGNNNESNNNSLGLGNQNLNMNPPTNEVKTLESEKREAEKKGSGGSFLWGLLTGILISLIGGAGAWFYLQPGASQSVQPKADNANLPAAPVADTDIHYLGILPLKNPTTMLEQFTPTVEYLKQKTGLNIELKLYQTGGDVGGYNDIVNDITKGNISFAYLASATAVQAEANGPVVPFACAQLKGSPTYTGDLAVKADSPYQTLEDLKGKKVSGTSISSVSGNLMPTAMLKAKGIDKTTYFDGGMQYLGSHDKAAEAVIAGTVDGCFINEATFKKYNKEKEALRSIWKHDPVPEFPFTVNTEKVTEEELAKVKMALLSMHETDLAGIQKVDPGYEKWVEIKWEDYADIKEAIDQAHGPIFYDLEAWGAEEKKEAEQAKKTTEEPTNANENTNSAEVVPNVPQPKP